MKKKIIINAAVILGMGTIMIGCSSKNKEKEDVKESTISEITKSKNSSESNIDRTNSEDKTEEGAVESEAVTSVEDYLYDVSLEQLMGAGSFYRQGVNIPQEITLALDEEGQGTVNFTVSLPEQTAETIYTITYQAIPTKTIRVSSSESNEIRSVNVNTELVLGTQQKSDNNADMSGNLYAFIAADGGLRLATPNYAGNMASGEEDVMLEYPVK